VVAAIAQEADAESRQQISRWNIPVSLGGFGALWSRPY
jgi:hypothetical protein